MVKSKFLHKPGRLIKDRRGSLQNIIKGNFSSCIEIFSKKGSIRSNHYHKKDSHFIYIIKGEILWAYKKLQKNSKLVIKKLKKGSLFYTPPLEEHLAYFIKDSHIMAFSPRTGKKIFYEIDTIRVNMEKYPKLKKAISKYKK